ncbi:NUDIX domain-containing protein [Nocardia sp. NBC_01730]|uniref:NUDIX hydrolase n=1 Tax=Nocardia sp. NBC_01730 TaxID=2975998 RepID=UPI002E0FCEF9|nr:NUDIX domain-containing protein [Nocardia sp. NBC_01730]
MSATVTERHKLIGDVHLVLVDDQGRYLFGRRANTGYEDGAWHLPSGHLESDESVVDALVREAAEEIGVVIAPIDVHFAHVMHNSSSGGRAAFFFLVSTWAGTPINQEPDKCDALEWFAPAELPDRMIRYCRAALSSIVASQPFSVYGW